MRGEIIGIDALYFAAARYYRGESEYAKIAGLIDESNSLAALAKRLDATAYNIQARIVYHARIKADIEARENINATVDIFAVRNDPLFKTLMGET